MNNTLPKVLVVAPTSVQKKYCFEAWLKAALSLHYPNYSIRVFDNTPNNRLYTDYMNKVFTTNYGEKNAKFGAYYVKSGHKNVNARIADSSNAMLQYAITKGFDYIFSLETDVICPPNAIEELMYHEKNVIGALYDRDEGRYRKLTIQKNIKVAPRFIRSMNLTDLGENKDEEITFVDGEVKKVSSVGLGCVLIKIKPVFVDKKINFRFDYSRSNFSPDSLFSEDCFRNNISIFAHTGVICQHFNNSSHWFGVDRKESKL